MASRKGKHKAPTSWGNTLDKMSATRRCKSVRTLSLIVFVEVVFRVCFSMPVWCAVSLEFRIALCFTFHTKPATIMITTFTLVSGFSELNRVNFHHYTPCRSQTQGKGWHIMSKPITGCYWFYVGKLICFCINEGYSSKLLYIHFKQYMYMKRYEKNKMYVKAFKYLSYSVITPKCSHFQYPLTSWDFPIRRSYKHWKDEDFHVLHLRHEKPATTSFQT